jgi:hypothetical protein
MGAVIQPRAQLHVRRPWDFRSRNDRFKGRLQRRDRTEGCCAPGSGLALAEKNSTAGHSIQMRDRYIP